MYDDKKFNYVEVSISKKDDMLEQLMDDLENWSRHLYPVEKKDSIVYRGLIPVKELKHLYLLQSMSPYGSGYDIVDDKERDRRFFKRMGLMF